MSLFPVPFRRQLPQGRLNMKNTFSCGCMLGAAKTLELRTIAEYGAASRQPEWTSIIMHCSAFKEITVSALTCS